MDTRKKLSKKTRKRAQRAARDWEQYVDWEHFLDNEDDEGIFPNTVKPMSSEGDETIFQNTVKAMSFAEHENMFQNTIEAREATPVDDQESQGHDTATTSHVKPPGSWYSEKIADAERHIAEDLRETISSTMLRDPATIRKIMSSASRTMAMSGSPTRPGSPPLAESTRSALAPHTQQASAGPTQIPGNYRKALQVQTKSKIERALPESASALTNDEKNYILQKLLSHRTETMLQQTYTRSPPRAAHVEDITRIMPYGNTKDPTGQALAQRVHNEAPIDVKLGGDWLSVDDQEADRSKTENLLLKISHGALPKHKRSTIYYPYPYVPFENIRSSVFQQDQTPSTSAPQSEGGVKVPYDAQIGVKFHGMSLSQEQREESQSLSEVKMDRYTRQQLDESQSLSVPKRINHSTRQQTMPSSSATASTSNNPPSYQPPALGSQGDNPQSNIGAASREFNTAQDPTPDNQLGDIPQGNTRVNASFLPHDKQVQLVKHPISSGHHNNIPQSNTIVSASVQLSNRTKKNAPSDEPPPSQIKETQYDLSSRPSSREVAQTQDPEDQPELSAVANASDLPLAIKKKKKKKSGSTTPSDPKLQVDQNPILDDQLNISQSIVPVSPSDREIQPAQHSTPDSQLNTGADAFDLSPSRTIQPAPNEQLENVLQSSTRTRKQDPSPSQQAVPLAQRQASVQPNIEFIQASSDEHERNEKYRQLELRGADALLDVSRHKLNWCIKNQLHYDAILPQKPSRPTGYASFITLETNYFALTLNQENFYSYKLNWEPPWIANKTCYRLWKPVIWQKAYGLLEATWKSQAVYEPTPHGNAYDLGMNMFLPESIPKIVYAKKLLAMRWKGVHTRAKYSRWDTTMHPIGFSIVSTSSTQRDTIVPTDMTDLRTKGGRYAKWHELQSALNSILYMHPGIITKWIEDRTNFRLFYPPGYPDNRNPLVKYVQHPTLGPSNYNDMYVFRRGFHSSIRLFPGGVYVNVWTCFTPFFRSNVTVDYAIDVILKEKQLAPYDGRCLSPYEQDIVSETLEHFRVETKLTRKVKEFLNPEIPTRCYRIWGLSRFSCRDLQVPIYARDEDGRNTLERIKLELFLPFCEQFFNDAFQQWPELDFKLVDEKLKGLPAIKVHKDKPYYFPPWALYIKENDKHPIKQGGLLSHSAFRMRDKSYTVMSSDNYINLVAEYVKWRTTFDVVLPAFKLQLNPTPFRVKGYLLPPPKGLLCYDYGSQRLFPPIVKPYGWFRTKSKNNWEGENIIISDRRSNREPQIFGMLQCPNIQSYMVLYLKPTTEVEARQWILTFLRMNSIRTNQQGFGALHTRTPFIRCCGEEKTTHDAFLLEFNNALNDYRMKTKECEGLPEVVFLMIPSWREDHQPYNAFKYRCDIELGIKSQVVRMQTWETKNQITLDASMLCFLLKFNKKMGGKNLVLRGPFVGDEGMPGTMIFGADVTHPAGNIAHSIASIVATNDMPPRTYGARVKIQAPHQEIIVETELMVESLVKAYQKNNPNNPLRRIFFFRDGVGEQQLQDVLSQEVPALINGLTKTGVNAKLVYLVCIKRHHTRFKDPKWGEIQPGCAVNEMPMFPLQTSFYLCTHLHPLPRMRYRGGCKPTYYHILIDQLGLSLPELQTVIYHLSYVYERSNINLSIIPASHYSHMACSRGRIHYKELCRINPAIQNCFPTANMTEIGYIYQKSTRTNLTPHKNLKDTMYYL